MTESGPRSSIGRHVFGAATFATGAIALAWHNDTDWVAVAAAAAQLAGGAALQFRRTAQAGAAVAGAAYLVLALLVVPRIVTTPGVYDSWGNFFEQFSLATGAAIAFARSSSAWERGTVARIGCALFGLCVVSFALEQAFYLAATAELVPKWLPPGQMFWALATTVAFALAAVALFANRRALLAARLLTAMIVAFGLLVWLPLLFSDPHSQTNWSEFAETFAIAGAAWILADLLGEVLGTSVREVP
jgi:hypothetical protein